MKRAKRIKLYHWFEEDQKARTGSKFGERERERERERGEGGREGESKFHVIGHSNYSGGLISQLVQQVHINTNSCS